VIDAVAMGAAEAVTLAALQVEPAGGLLPALSDNPFLALGALFGWHLSGHGVCSPVG